MSRQQEGDEGAGAARPRVGLQLVKSDRCMQGLLGPGAARARSCREPGAMDVAGAVLVEALYPLSHPVIP